MFFGLGVINIDLGGLVAIIVTSIGVIVWFVRLESSTKSNKKDNEDTKKDIENMKCEMKEFRSWREDLNVKVEGTKKDVEYIKQSIDDVKNQGSQILELVTSSLNKKSK